MRRPVRIVPFIILNIFVSVVTALVVLFVWNNSQPPSDLPPIIFPTEISPTQPSNLAPATPQPLPTEARPLQVVDVLGAGDVKNEVIQFKYNGEGELRLAGWRMEDNQGHRYTFPNYTLGKGGTVKVYTRAGVDSATELFWGLAESVWKTGKTIVVYDMQDIVRASFVVP